MQSSDDRIDSSKGSINSLKFLTGCLAVIAISLIVFIMVTTLYESDNNTTDEKSAEMKVLKRANSYSICRRPICQDIAQHLTSLMNTTVDPCEDFYEFVCGGFKYPQNATQTMTRDKVDEIFTRAYSSKTKSRSKAVGYLKRFRERCIEDVKDQDKEVETLKRFITEFGGMTLIDAKRYNASIPWWKRQAMLLREFSYVVWSYFDLGTIINLKIDSDGITLTNPDPCSPNKLFPRSYCKLGFNNSKSKVFFENMICILRGKEPCSYSSQNSAEFQEVVAFEKHFYAFLDATRRVIKKKITLKEVEAMIPDMPWLDFLNEVFKKSMIIVGKKDNIVFKAVNIRYFQKLSAFINHCKPSVVANYLGLHFINQFADLVIKNETYFKISGKIFDRKAVCDDKLLMHFFPEVKSRLFIEHANLSLDEVPVREIALNVQKSFLNLIEDAQWLDQTAKVVLKSKINEVELKLGHPKWIGNDAILDALFGVEINVEESPFIELVRDLLRFTANVKFQKVLSPSHRIFKWYVQPFENVALNMKPNNYLLIPNAKYLPSAYWRDGVKAINYGNIGMAIAHEFGHCIDNDGITYDSFGNSIDYTEIWDNYSVAGFRERVECLEDQYNLVYDSESRISLNARATINEDIADNVGTRAAYYAYLMSGEEDERLPGLEDFNDHKLFFIATASFYCSTLNKEQMEEQIANEHSPNKFRAYLPLTNFDKFSEVFRCSNESFMNRKNKCVVW